MVRFKPSSSATTGFHLMVRRARGDVRPALFWIIGWQRLVHDLRFAADHLHGQFCELKHREFIGVAKIERTNRLRLLHEAAEPFNQITDKAEGTCLRAIAINGEILAAQRLDNEIGDDATVVGQHPRPIGVEDACDPDIDPILVMVIEKERSAQRLPSSYTTNDGPIGLTSPPVGFRLGIHLGVAIQPRKSTPETPGLSRVWRDPGS